MTCGAIRLRSARPRLRLSWPRPAPASGSGRRRPDRLRPRLPARPRRHRLEAQGFRLPFRALPRLAQNEERKCTGCEAGSRGGLVKGAPQMSVAPPGGQNRIMIYGPKDDGTYIVEFRTAAGEALAISIPRSEASVIRHFQERMPYGLFVPDVP